MLIIELEPELESSLNVMAKEQHLAVEELVKQFIKQRMPKKQESELLIDMLKSLPKIACFEGKDPLALQQEWRSEWD